MDAVPIVEPRRLRRIVLVVAGLNLAYAVVEAAVALAIGSVSLLADSVDFVEDTAVNLLIALALGWPLARRAVVGHVLALIILVPALVAAWQAVVKAFDPVATRRHRDGGHRGRGSRGQHGVRPAARARAAPRWLVERGRVPLGAQRRGREPGDHRDGPRDGADRLRLARHRARLRDRRGQLAGRVGGVDLAGEERLAARALAGEDIDD